MKPQRLWHKHGGRITNVHGIGHTTDSNKVPWWFYVCDIAWDDAPPLTERRVEPILLCREADDTASFDEINALSEHMNAYLQEAGEWLEKPKQIGDYLIHWLPRKKSGFRAIA